MTKTLLVFLFVSAVSAWAQNSNVGVMEVLSAKAGTTVTAGYLQCYTGTDEEVADCPTGDGNYSTVFLGPAVTTVSGSVLVGIKGNFMVALDILQPARPAGTQVCWSNNNNAKAVASSYCPDGRVVGWLVKGIAANATSALVSVFARY